MVRSIRAEDPLQLGRWTLTGRLGQGSTALVYRAVTEAGDVAALKAAPSGTRDTPVRPLGATALAREGDILASLSGVEGVNGLVEVGLDDSPYLALEYIEGPTLAELLARRERLDTATTVSLAVQLATSLAGVHARGVVHGDINPANLILGPQGLVVVDFGTAAGGDPQATWAGHSLLSPVWVAPEILEGGLPTMAADVFAWAATVAVCSAGRQAGGSMASRTPLALPARVAELVKAGAASDAQQRPTMTELVTALSRTRQRAPVR